ncbi:hypothetical protein POJ06DRAFT_147143 [Lipomyces tetrasporus]|uniref:C2H2-type domain-containing protein n=1 Tax=Lipomyces tetrasporus TaxID=54092 RepID=A0AAD7VRK3_9ASCO|nr:uncharacterized protein POJ06DRAFT_147143 [Lipomyces tetrasporus]KAJ8098215.1 hypothetical protein POJ06DRAFT_147143 [Lipomyces tetrasporus]
MGSIRRSKTKRRTRDLDQVHQDLSSEASVQKLSNQPLDESKPGLGQYYCIECAKYFETDFAKTVHRRGKNHKRRVRMLKEQPYSQAEADAASGLGVEKYMRFVETYEQAKMEKEEKEKQRKENEMVIE